MKIPNIDELKSNIDGMYSTFDWLGTLDNRAKVLAAAETLLTLMKFHPNLEALIKGEAVIVRNPVTDMHELAGLHIGGSCAATAGQSHKGDE